MVQTGLSPDRGRRSQKVKPQASLNELLNHLKDDLSQRSPDEVADYARERMLSRMRKRVRLANEKDVEIAALERFKFVNDEVGAFSVSDLEFSELLGEAQSFIRHVLRRYGERIDPTLPPSMHMPVSVLHDNWRFGPKASHEVDGLGTVEKIEQPWTCTRLAEPHLRNIRMANVYLSSIDAGGDHSSLKVIAGSKVTSVPKNEDTVRIIATEPSGNMLLQLAVGRFLEGALAAIGLNIRTQQPRNRAAARLGSLYGDLCTMDLKEASDRMSLQMIKLLWPDDMFKWFYAFRSPECRIPSLNNEVVELKMVSTMGNGFTFPLMTMTILAIIYATRRLQGGPRLWIDLTKTFVFGDDIIVPTSEFHSVANALRRFGFIVNDEKSYYEGPFRESCGGDYYKGQDVSPVYVKSLAAPSECYVVLNQLLDWSSRHEIPLFRSIRYVRRMLRKVYIVPEWAPPDSGVRLAGCPKRYKLLQSVPIKRKYKGKLTFMLCVGQFLSQDRDGVFTYNVHPDFVKYRTQEATLPSGYVDGWDPLLGSLKTSSYRTLIWSIAT